MFHKTAAIAMGVAMSLALFGTDSMTLAQSSRIQQAMDVIYAELPEFPLENIYVSGKGPQPQNTLVRRILAYHIHTQGRSRLSRLDWKLTLADYLDLNEPMFAGVYPSANVLTVNPHSRDRQVVQALSRQERDALLAAIYKAFDVDAEFQSLAIANPAEAQTSVKVEDESGGVEVMPETLDLAPESQRSPSRPARGSADQLL